MSRVIYKIVEHGEGWAYQVQGTYSETFPSADAARAAARIAALEQAQPGKEAPAGGQGSGSTPVGSEDHRQPPKQRNEIHNSIHLSRMLS